MSYTYTQLPPDYPAIFKTIVEDTVNDNISDIIQDNGYKNLHFKHDNWSGLMKQLSAEKASKQFKNDMYPLIALIHNFKEPMSETESFYEVSLDFAIITLSNINWYGFERWERNYTPLLHKIYAEFLTVVNNDSHFIGYNELWPKHTKIDALDMAKDGATKYSVPDTVDATFIEGLQLKVKTKKIDC